MSQTIQTFPFFQALGLIWVPSPASDFGAAPFHASWHTDDTILDSSSLFARNVCSIERAHDYLNPSGTLLICAFYCNSDRRHLNCRPRTVPLVHAMVHLASGRIDDVDNGMVCSCVSMRLLQFRFTTLRDLAFLITLASRFWELS